MADWVKNTLKRYEIDSLENRDEAIIERTVRYLSGPMKRYFRFEVRGLERLVPGAGLFVGNHNGGLLSPDTWILAAAMCETLGVKSVPYGLGHEFAISLPLIHQVVMPLGCVRASHKNAMALFERGRRVMVYPGGDLEAFRPFRHRNRIVFGGRRGYIRLALTANVPIIPVVAAGAHRGFIIVDDLQWLARIIGAKRFLRIGVWPITVSIPWGVTLGVPPPYIPLPTRILMETLPPIHFERSGQAAAEDEIYVAECADIVETRMQAALTRLADERRAFRKAGI